jgi:two-component system NarL family response regulator
MRKNRLRLLIADDHFVVRLGLLGALRADEQMAVVAEAEDGEEAVALHAKHQPDVTIMDARMPKLDGVAAMRAIRERTPGARFVMLSVHDGEEDIHRAIEAGAGAFLLKDAAGPELLDAIRAVHRGETYIPARIAERLRQRQSREDLTERELEVLRELCRGGTNKEIAAVLHISPMTVKIHVAHVIKKLGVLDRTQAVAIALDRGWVKKSEL